MFRFVSCPTDVISVSFTFVVGIAQRRYLVVNVALRRITVSAPKRTLNT
jgi:hypothetical protein